METDTVTLPKYWATALINGDYSGLENSNPAEAQRCRAVAAQYAAEGWHFANCEEEGRFTWSYDLYDIGSPYQGGSVLEYTIIGSKRK